MEARANQLSVVLQDNVIHATLAGVISEQLLLERHDRVLALISESGCRAVLYNILGLEPPALDLVELQHKLNAELQKIDVKLAVVVPGSRLAYLARLAFGDLNYRVFYESVSDALQWLRHTPREEKYPKRVLIADVPEAMAVLTQGLDQHFQVIPRTSWIGACAAVHEGIDLVLCGLGFEESKMFELLDYLRSQQETRSTPFFCIKSIRQKLPSTINSGIGIALHAKGMAGYLDFEGWQVRFGEREAAAILRRKISEALAASGAITL